MKNLKIIVLLLSLTVGSTTLSGQKKIKWLTWEEAISKSSVEKKKIIVDIYTQWCGWCKKMEKSTFMDEFIVEYVNEHFYPVKFDAEFKDIIQFNGKEYKYIKKGRRGYHELAVELTKGKLSFPTIVFLDTDLNVLQPIPGFQDNERFELIVTYFAGDHFKYTPWRRYTRNYSRETFAYPAGTIKN
jgi:thioredoxin-related protein